MDALRLAILWVFFYCSLPVGLQAQRGKKADASHWDINWDTASMVRISPEGKGGYYPRMIQLADGSLVCVYGSQGSVWSVSSSNGRQWSSPVLIAARRDSINMDTPDLLQLKNGQLMVCYATRPQSALRGQPKPGEYFEIRVQHSSNNGQSWAGEQTLYTAGESFKNGCWEPSAVQLPNGSLQLFFADEAPYTQSDEQNISMLHSSDNGQHWTKQPQIISFRPHSRDGMPVSLWQPEYQRLLVTIEDPGIRHFKPYILASDSKGEWRNTIDGNSAHRWYAVHPPMPDSVYAGAPYLRRFSNGVLLLSYQTTEGRNVHHDRDAVLELAIANADGKQFHRVQRPFKIDEGKNALWNSVCILKDDTIIALSCTNQFSKRQAEVWMVKGKIRY